MPTSSVAEVMREFRKGQLHSGSKKGPKVKKKSQALAIALSQQRKKGKMTAKMTTTHTRKARSA